MKRNILLLSGAFGAGKTRTASQLIDDFDFLKIGSSQYLLSLIPVGDRRSGDSLREQLQELGDRLDIDTDYRWIVDPVATSALLEEPMRKRWLVDAVRKSRQVDHFRAEFGDQIRHVHLVASEDTLMSRYSFSNQDYERASNHPNEIASRSLVQIANQVIHTDDMEPAAIAAQISALWGEQHA